jgi:hypothetical protein
VTIQEATMTTNASEQRRVVVSDVAPKPASAAPEPAEEPKKVGEVVEAVADFWLGMITAGAKGFGALTERVEQRTKREKFHETVAGALAAGAAAALEKAAETADQTKKELSRKPQAKG